MNSKEILAIHRMLHDEKLDIRTVTMGISLLDCVDSDEKKAQKKIYDKITKYAENLVEYSDAIGTRYGVKIVNKRLAVTPMSLVTEACKNPDYIAFAETLDRAAQECGVDFIGGYGALVAHSASDKEMEFIQSIPYALSETDLVCAPVNVASTKAGINMEAVREMGKITRKTAELTKDTDSSGCTKLVVFCNAVDDNPFMAGAFHGANQGDAAIRVGVSGPGVVKSALEKYRGQPFEKVADAIKIKAFQITRLGSLLGHKVAEALGMNFTTIDLSLAPTPAVGDSVGRILEEIGLSEVGTHGTTCALALLNDSVKKGGIMASTHVGGLSGAFIPVSEDEGLTSAAASGMLTMDKLEAMTSVCSVGLDMICVPGDTPASTLSAITADECAIGMINGKTTATRLIPVIGKGVGQVAEFGGLMGHAPIIPVHKGSSQAMIDRGGRIPAPIHSFKN